MKELFFGGRIITNNGDANKEAVLVENGKIAAVGDKAALDSADAKKTDLRGGTLMPSFIDAHSHLSQMASETLQVKLTGTGSPKKAADRIAGFIEKNGIGNGDWVIANSYEGNDMRGDAAELSKLLAEKAPENPVVVQHGSGHFGVFSRSALSELGVSEATKAPQGGDFGRKDGRLTGYMEERAYMEYIKKVPLPGMDALADAFSRAQQKYASYGITTVQEGLMVREMLPMYEELLRRDTFFLHVVGYPDAQTIDAAIAAIGIKDDNNFRIGGMKIFLDGSPQGRTAWLREPYEGGDGFCGYGTMKDEDVMAAVEKSAKLGIQILAHCNGDAAAAQYIRCVDECEKKYPVIKELRPVMIHAQLLGRDQLDDVKRLGIIPSFFVAHVYHFGDVHIKNFGMERAEHISPAGSAAKKGILFTFHQDSPVIMPDMLETIWCAVNRRTKGGVVLGRDEAISVEDAIRAVTVNAAAQYGEKKGVIAPGQSADLVLLDRDVIGAEPESIRDIGVVRTIKGGETVFEA